MYDTKSSDMDSNPESTVGSYRWSIGSALLASVCCVGPLVAILVAGGTAAGAVGLVRFKLEFIAVGLVVNVIGIGLSLRKSKRCCSVKTYRRNRILIPAVSLLVFAVLVAGSNLLLLNDRVIGAASARIGGPANRGTDTQPAALSANRLDVEITSGVSCPSCLLAIQKQVTDTQGVQQVALTNEQEGFVAQITYDPAQVDQATLLRTIAETPGAVGGQYGTKVLRDGPVV